MGIGVSVFLLALGAILTFAVEASVSGLDINVVGVILMAAGAIGLVVTGLILGRNRGAVAGTVVEEPYARERVVRERDVL